MNTTSSYSDKEIFKVKTKHTKSRTDNNSIIKKVFHPTLHDFQCNDNKYKVRVVDDITCLFLLITFFTKLNQHPLFEVDYRNQTPDNIAATHSSFVLPATIRSVIGGEPSGAVHSEMAASDWRRGCDVYLA